MLRFCLGDLSSSAFQVSQPLLAKWRMCLFFLHGCDDICSEAAEGRGDLFWFIISEKSQSFRVGRPGRGMALSIVGGARDPDCLTKWDQETEAQSEGWGVERTSKAHPSDFCVARQAPKGFKIVPQSGNPEYGRNMNLWGIFHVQTTTETVIRGCSSCLTLLINPSQSSCICTLNPAAQFTFT